MAALLWTGVGAAALAIATLGYSIAQPHRRLWPPLHPQDKLTGVLAWALTLLIFGAALGVGLMEWGRFALPLWLRFTMGGLLVFLGNLAVWSCVTDVGMAQTSGATGQLHTTGLYAWSRHPQYVAGMGILLGWTLLSASLSVAIIAALGSAALMLAAVAEEPWLARQHPDTWHHYAARTPRFM